MNRLQTCLVLITLSGLCRGLCPVHDCVCDDRQLRVTCAGFNLKEIPITLNPHISKLQIRETALNKLDAALQFYPYLKELDLSSNKIEALPALSFEHQHSLNRLNLNHNLINKLDVQAFVSLSNLTSLHLRSNAIKTLESRLFSPLITLRELDLSENEIQSVQTGSFDGLIKLQVLKLDYNRLTSFPQGTLFGLKGLRYLYLSHNSLHRLNLQLPFPAERSGKLNLEFLDISFTDLPRMELCHLLDFARNLKHLVFFGNSADQLACIESNSIQTLEIGYTSTLASLDPVFLFSMSQLKNFKVIQSSNLVTVTEDAFMANTVLEVIEIIDNPSLGEISLSSFSHLSHLRKVLLRNNSIYLVSASNHAETNFVLLEEIDISENPLDCNCTLRALAGTLGQKVMKCSSNKNPINSFHLGNLLTGDLTCLSPHTIKVLFLGTLTVVIVTVVAISVTVHLIHFRRSRKEQRLLRLENVENLWATFRNQVVDEELFTNPSVISTMAWRENFHQSESNLTEKDRGGVDKDLGHFSMPRYGRYPYKQQQPLCFIDVPQTPCQCNYSHTFQNWKQEN